MAKKLTWTAVVLLIAGVLVVSGVVPVGRAVGLYVTLPVGVVLLGMSLIWRMLERQEEAPAGAAASEARAGHEPAGSHKEGGCGCGCRH